jgi:hypothetical protein
MVLALYRLIAAIVVLGMMMAATAIMMATWLAVIAFGVLAPGWTPRRACTGWLAFIHEAVAHVRALDPQGQNKGKKAGVSD